MKLNRRHSGKWYLFVAITAVVLVYLGFLAIVLVLAPLPLESAGQLGDSFGLINVLFSGLAFAVVACSILLQWEQMANQDERLQRERDQSVKDRETQLIIARIQGNSSLVNVYLSQRSQAEGHPEAIREYDLKIVEAAGKIEEILNEVNGLHEPATGESALRGDGQAPRNGDGSPYTGVAS